MLISPSIIAVHHKTRPDRLPLPDTWNIWETDTPIGETYKELAMHAVDNSWGHEIIVVQDDVRFTEDFYDYDRTKPGDEDIIVYGQTKEPNHVCPRAFSASVVGWKILEDMWLPAPNTLCRGFTIAVNQSGIVHDWTVHLG